VTRSLGSLLAVTAALAILAAANPVTATVLRLRADQSDLQAVIDRAQDGDVIELPAGRWQGPLTLDKAVILRGEGSVIDGGNVGNVIVVDAPGARLEGLTIQNSGGDVGAPDCCVYVTKKATGAVIRDNRMQGCVFGIWIHETDAAQIVGNHIAGRTDLRSADRGNGIHLFNASHLVVSGNHVEQARDGIYVSATEDSLIEDNVTVNLRFGIHYMYSYRNTLRGNVANDNAIGLALMESLHLVIEENEARRNDRYGILFRDVQHSQIRRNTLEENAHGMFFFSSTDNVVEDNRIANNQIGMKVWAGTRRNGVSGNHFVGNRHQVFYVGSEDQVWGTDGPGNRWGDYIGWDQDGDGIGDRPHRVESFKSRLLYKYPAVALLLRSPALEMLSHLSERLPVMRSPAIVDLAPIVGGRAS
jgi:nitrous oxidase accessory protein